MTAQDFDSPDSREVKAAVDALGRAFEDFKAANNAAAAGSFAPPPVAVACCSTSARASRCR